MSRKSKVISMDLPSKLSHQLVFSSGETSLDPSLVKKIIRVIEEHERPKNILRLMKIKNMLRLMKIKNYFMNWF